LMSPESELLKPPTYDFDMAFYLLNIMLPADDSNSG